VETNKKSRSIYLEVIRIVACLMVIFNHTNERGFYRLSLDRLGSASFYLDTLMSIVCKAGVPLFFMISGTLLLGKEESVKKTWKRAVRILIDLFVFSIAYFWIDAILQGNQFSLATTLIIMLSSNYWHLWYLYAYIVLLIAMPVMRKFVSGMDEKSSFYMFWLAFFFMGIMPILTAIAPSGINENLSLVWLTKSAFLYPIWGYLLDHKIKEDWFTKERIIYLWIFNAMCIIASCALEYSLMHRTMNDPNKVEGYFDERYLINFCIVNTTAIYVTARYIFNKIKVNEIVEKAIVEIGADTFGIYLLHIWFLWKIPAVYAIWMKFEHAGVIGYHFGILFSCLGTFILAGIVTSSLRRVPVIKKLF